MERVYFLQEIGVSRSAMTGHLAARKVRLEPCWPDGEAPPAEEVVALVTVDAPVSEAVLNRYPAVRLVAVAFTGFDHVDLAACRARGIGVANVPAYSTDSVAELAVALAVALLRQIPQGDRRIREGGWELPSPGGELAGRTVGLLGLGRVGLRAAALFAAFNCPLLGWSRREPRAFQRLGGKMVSRLELFSRADVVSLHLPLTTETRGLVARAELEAMKPGACLVNTARGPLVDEQALVSALREGRIRAALDVFEEEPLPADHPLRETEGTILLPHLGFRTTEALERRAAVTAENLAAFFRDERHNRVDAPPAPRYG